MRNLRSPALLVILFSSHFGAIVTGQNSEKTSLEIVRKSSEQGGGILKRTSDNTNKNTDLLSASRHAKKASRLVQDREIAAAALITKGSLGRGYNTKKEAFVGECVFGNVEFVGGQGASASIDRSLSQQELSNALGFSAGAKARYGVTQGSIEAKFASSASSNAYSEVTIYSARYKFKNKKFQFKGLTDRGNAAKGFTTGTSVGDDWEKVCGHEYVDQITLGASLYFSAKIEFSSKAEKEAFSGSFNIKGPAFSASGELQKASKSFGNSASVTIQAYQQGGDVTRLGAIFGRGDDATVTVKDGSKVHALLVCSMSNLDACLKVFNAALLYATDTRAPEAFSQQIRPNVDLSSPNGPAELSYITGPWSNFALLPPPPIIAEGIKAARQTLSFEFEKNFAYQNRAIALQAGSKPKLSPRQRLAIEKIGIIVAENLNLINEAANICYSELDKCVEKVSETKPKLKSISESELEVRPETLAQWFDIKDLPSTKKATQNTLNLLFAKAGTQVVDFDRVEDKSKVAEDVLSNTITLEIDGEQISDLDLQPLTYLTDLQYLNLGKHRFTDIKPLTSLKNMRSLFIGGSNIPDLTSFAKSVTVTMRTSDAPYPTSINFLADVNSDGIRDFGRAIGTTLSFKLGKDGGGFTDEEFSTPGDVGWGYNSPLPWMEDVDNNGRPDFCRYVGGVPSTPACLLAKDKEEGNGFKIQQVYILKSTIGWTVIR